MVVAELQARVAALEAKAQPKPPLPSRPPLLPSTYFRGAIDWVQPSPTSDEALARALQAFTKHEHTGRAEAMRKALEAALGGT